MKRFALGFISAVILMGVIYLAAVFKRAFGPQFGERVTTKEDPLLGMGWYVVRRDNELLFRYYVNANTLGLHVPSESPGVDRLFFEQSDQGERGTFCSLSTGWIRSDGGVERVTYDMKTGDVRYRYISDSQGVRVFDKNGFEATPKEAKRVRAPAFLAPRLFAGLDL
jgi:hypothetical protein